MVKKTYLSPRAELLACEEQDVVTASGFVETNGDFDDNMASWEEVFGS